MLTDQLPKIALSIRQPWAWAIFNGKDVENRSHHAINHGMKPGRICIHASKGMTRDEYESAAEFMASIGVKCPPPADLIRGAILGTALVTDIIHKHASPWFFGPCGLLLAEQALLPAPIPQVGALGYFHWADMGHQSKALEEPTSWMSSWPDNPRRKNAPRPPPVQPSSPDLFQ